jgi:hypothetical protein
MVILVPLVISTGSHISWKVHMATVTLPRTSRARRLLKSRTTQKSHYVCCCCRRDLKPYIIEAVTMLRTGQPLTRIAFSRAGPQATSRRLTVKMGSKV